MYNILRSVYVLMRKIEQIILIRLNKHILIEMCMSNDQLKNILVTIK